MSSDPAADVAAATKRRNRHHRSKRSRDDIGSAELPTAAAVTDKAAVSEEVAPAPPGNDCIAETDEPHYDEKEYEQEAASEHSEHDVSKSTAAAPARSSHQGSKGLHDPPAIIDDYRELNLNPHIVSSLENIFSFKDLTPVQARTIPAALAGRDLLAEAKTGSGKTLAFLIPVIENISRSGFRPVNGTASIIIGPTRELCQQIEGVLLKLLKFFNGSITFICCIGGQNRKQEEYKLATGSMIVISSPGRLLDHLKMSEKWNTRKLLMLTVDEADRVLDNGFEDDLREIVQLLPTRRQTFLFSATQTTRVEQLARISFYKTPVYISLKSRADKATVDTLEQGYVVCPSEYRLMLLYYFVKKNRDKKMLVFFSSRNSVSFHAELFNYVDIPCVAFHGKQKQHQRSATYMQFCNAPSGVLFTTDVAARGLDIPRVDWIVQFDPSDDPVKYVHRVGRTARAGLVGNALLFLLPSEQLFLRYLYDDAHVSVNEYAVKLEKLVANNVNLQLENLINSNYYLRKSASEAFEGYLLSYSSTQLKNVFDIHSLDLNKVATGFGLKHTPSVNLDLSQSAAHLNKKARKEFKQQQQSKDPRRKASLSKGKSHQNISGQW